MLTVYVKQQNNNHNIETKCILVMVLVIRLNSNQMIPKISRLVMHVCITFFLLSLAKLYSFS